ncbi:unnamed protein product, partial [Tuber aestivum]
MNTGGEEQRWRHSRTQQQSSQQRSQGGGGQRRNVGGSSGSNGSNAWQNSNQQQMPPVYAEAHVPVRAFNGKEVEDFLSRAYEKEVFAAKQSGDQGQKPIIYKSDKGWSTPKSGGAWGSRPNAMASGSNFVSQLRRGQAALQQGSGKE